MNGFKNLRIGKRLMLMLGSVLLMLMAVTAAGQWGLGSLLGTTQRVLAQDVQLARLAAELQTQVLLERRFEKDTFINIADAAKRASYVKRWSDTRAALSATLERTLKMNLEPDDRAAMQAMQQHFGRYAQGFEATLAAIGAGSVTTTQDANADIGKVKDAVRDMEAAAEAINDRAMKRVAAVGEVITATHAQASAAQFGFSLVALLLAVGLGWAVTRSITQPLSEAVRVAQTVATGDLSSRIEVKSRDELGELMGALKRMNDSLVTIVGQVRNASDSIATGSAQIATGNADLSHRTEEQASNLQQTAASMEELTATVRQNADTARQATQLAGGATDVAQQGGDVVGQVVGTMQQISDSSKKIADIISVIDGIAFQTNILALNAAVEAARAGEQGRGFAVVAGEVRTLAQRSAQAAREIKSLIGDSVGKVEAGSALVDRAGRTMNDIVSQVRKVSDLIGEISHAGAEQTGGIDQINSAVTQLDHVTQQNAALVEESAAAAESLKHQAARLNELVAVFRV